MRKRTLKIVTCLGVIVVFLGIVYSISVALAAAKVRRAYAALEKAGRPMHVEDVVPPAVPDTENAALLYESAALLLRSQPAGEKNLLGRLSLTQRARAESEDAIDPAETRRLLGLEVVDQALAMVKQGTSRAGCRFDRDYEAGSEMLMPNLLDIKALSRILRDKALLAAEAGDSEQAWDLCETQLRFADALRQEPVLVPQMVRLGMIGGSCATIQELCRAVLPDKGRQKRIEELLIVYDDVTPLSRAVDGERLLSGDWIFNLPRDEVYTVMYRYYAESYVPEIFNRIKLWRAMFKPTFLADHAAYLRVMLESAQQFERPYVREEVIVEDMEFFTAQKHHWFTSALTPATVRLNEIYLGLVADLRMTRAGLALLRYRETHGAFPDTLDALGLEGLADPFLEPSQLLYKKTPDGFVVYSVAEDQKDNDGVPRQPYSKADYDIAWRFPNP